MLQIVKWSAFIAVLPDMFLRGALIYQEQEKASKINLRGPGRNSCFREVEFGSNDHIWHHEKIAATCWRLSTYSIKHKLVAEGRGTLAMIFAKPLKMTRETIHGPTLGSTYL